jgi:hypothetical protein
VEFQRFLAVVRGQGVDGVGQRGKGVFHGGISSWFEILGCRLQRDLS